MGAIETSLKSNAAAIIVTTMTGRSAVLLSTYRPKCPIVAVTRYGAVARWLQLYYGLHSFHYKSKFFFLFYEVNIHKPVIQIILITNAKCI